MELRDYLRMLRRGWPVVVLITGLFVALASVYLTLTPKVYESTAVLLVSAGKTDDTGDLAQGGSFASSAVNSYARIVNSAAVLGPVAAQMNPSPTIEDLQGKITVVVPEDTRLIQITAAGDDSGKVATLANATAGSASRVIPTLENTADLQSTVRVTQIVQATEALSPVSPSVKRILALGFVIGFCVGLGVTIAAQTLDTRLRQVDDIRALTEVPLLAALPRFKRAQQYNLVVRDEPSGAIGEAFRTLRTNLRFLEAKDRRSMVFTAVSDDREGAQVPANLAWSLVQAEWRVLLVDLDLRHSTVADAFAARVAPGLADVLMGQAQLQGIIRDTNHPRLKIVTSGTQQVSPADLLSAPAMTNVLRRMEQAFDYVILHAPPLLSYTDAALVSDTAGGTFLTVSAGRTRAQELTTALGTLANVRVKPLGIVLTGARDIRTGGRVKNRVMAGVVRRRTDAAAGPLDVPATPTRTSASRSATPRLNLDPPTLRHHPAQHPKRPAAPPARPAEPPLAMSDPRNHRGGPRPINGDPRPAGDSSRPTGKSARSGVDEPGPSAVEPRPTVYRYQAFTPEPARPVEEPRRAPDPEFAHAEPEPEPTAYAEPEPTVYEPEPEDVAPEPTTHAPEPTADDHEPEHDEPEPEPEPEPESTEPGSTPDGPHSDDGEPAVAAAEPGPTAGEPDHDTHLELARSGDGSALRRPPGAFRPTPVKRRGDT